MGSFHRLRHPHSGLTAAYIKPYHQSNHKGVITIGLKTEIEQKEATNEPKLFVSWRGAVAMKLTQKQGYVVIHAPSVENVGNHLIGDLEASGWEVFTGSVTLTQD